MQLIFHDVSKSYGSNLALQHFSATLEPGIYALLGPNGSGKSTLMNILTDNLRADSGEILFAPGDDAPENMRKMGVRFREKIGFMPQYPGMYANFTIGQFMWYMASLKDIGAEMARKERKCYVDECIRNTLTSVELADVIHQKIGTLSGGMKQRLGLAQAVLGDPDILVLDEPTAGLDPKQRIAVRNYIAKIALNKIVIFATHVVSDIEFIARSIIMLKKGVIIDNAAPHELVEKINGKVWNVSIAADEVAQMQQRFRVTNIARDEQDPQCVFLRIISDAAPADHAVPAAPTLEDYYLYVHGEV